MRPGSGRVQMVNVLLLASLLGVTALVLWLDHRTEWRRRVMDARRALRVGSPGAAYETGPVQITVFGGKAVDRCPTCHTDALATSAPARGTAATGRRHPRVEGHADLTRFGCTSCHGGQGRRLDRQAHEPRLGGGPDPFLGQPFLQARCARCHIPGAVRGAPMLDRGIQEYLEAGCSGCHQPGRFEEGLGPDLRRLGCRSEAELRSALLEPELDHPSAVMWSLRWRYDQQTPAGRDSLAALITAILAISDSPEPYRSGWSRPGVDSEADCAGCHLRGAEQESGARRHRCPFLVDNQSLRCASCHGMKRSGAEGESRGPAAPEPSARTNVQRCPQLRAARPTCTVCHGRQPAASPAVND